MKIFVDYDCLRMPLQAQHVQAYSLTIQNASIRPRKSGKRENNPPPGNDGTKERSGEKTRQINESLLEPWSVRPRKLKSHTEIAVATLETRKHDETRRRNTVGGGRRGTFTHRSNTSGTRIRKSVWDSLCTRLIEGFEFLDN